MAKTKNKSKSVNPAMSSYQKMRQDEEGTVIFTFEKEFFNEEKNKYEKKVVAKQVLKLSKTAIEKRSISELLTLLNSIMHHIGASSYTF